ncbi:uncharacterized protein BP01DRAFT_337306 [Aspergillus saccharolyticus JOP 1030-1]|uniref:G domain-containing protein n=1 Tax=Aspergillus saccharolyticus JOP 1030-1 TaxID=1450539 RepID=A0A319A3Z1_9EURO|nr:hypothetical protein BP01DRAFT_337306 [Aspergillus saccharolyticus JOP 1030-1]PYH46848.1 hypothetical protein BP01DRAFT_337306 [Aspergillus saccharolyticus JOP 1030-1]
MPPYLGRILPRATRIHRLPSHFQPRAGRLPLHLLTRPGPTRRTPESRCINHQLLRSYSTTDSPSTTEPPSTAGLPAVTFSSDSAPDFSSPISADVLPICCPGCGAYAQTVDPNEPGYYSKTRKQTRKQKKVAKQLLEDEAAEWQKAGERIQQYLTEGTADWGKSLGKPKDLLQKDIATASEYLDKTKTPTQKCDRCHDLLNENKAVPAISPTIDSIRAYLDESPHKHNHVYLLVDAVDFPMSLVDNIHKALNIMDPRSRNRRSATHQYRGSKRLPTLHIIITRSDLLAAKEEQVDSKMEYVRRMLRIRLGLEKEEVRLGQVHMISAKRGWWTKKVKEEIQKHGGGVWVVGKANVGKSSFIEACFPKDSENLEKIASLLEQREEESQAKNQQHPDFLASDGLLPPAPREEMFPVLPVVSSLAGTTVSPIRIPFGRGRGEMIDLPGLERGNLADFVLPEYQRNLLMTKRVEPEDTLTIKGHQSLLLCGGLIRITPVNPEDIVLAACFVPFDTHVTSTQKALAIQSGDRDFPNKPILRPETYDTFTSAGRINLQWDVTKSHLPTRIAKAAADKGVPIPRLPYRVMAADVLIEGCGWVELTVQTRAEHQALELDDYDEDAESDLLAEFEDDSGGGGVDAGRFSRTPQVEVFTPHGRHIGSRPPLETWKFIADYRKAKARRMKERKRQSISRKKRVQASRRAQQSSS